MMVTKDVMMLVADKDIAVKIINHIKAHFHTAYGVQSLKLVPFVEAAFRAQGIEICVNENTANALISRLEKKSKISFI